MSCNDCTLAKQSLDSISVAAHETIMAREDKKNRRLVWLVVLLIIALLATNIAWLITWNSYDFVDETYDYSQDGRGINIIGNDNDADQENFYEPAISDTP